MTNPIRTLIVDDEPLARRRIRALLERESDIQIVGECASGTEALDAITEQTPDLVFLDIQMPGLDGLGVVAEIDPDEMPIVVFVTAYDQYALKAFEAHALDYLLKPFEDERFADVLQRVRVRVAERDPHTLIDERIAAVLEELKPKVYPERIVIRKGTQYVFQPVHEVDWVEADGNYARIHAGANSSVVRKTMAAMEHSLDPARFVRIHRSTIVNIERIRAVESLFNGEYVVILKDGTKLPTSRSYRDAVQALLSGAA
jgi:two-component system LytT family response regulator